MACHRSSFLARYALLLGLSLAAMACRLLVYESPTVSGEGRLLFEDDFSDPTSGWNRASTPSGESDYQDGVYRILVNEPNLDIWSMPGLYFSDVRLEVDAFKVGGERDNRFGLICRAEAQDRFYTFVISSDGYYGVGLVDGERYSLLGMDALQPSEAVRVGSALNHLRADCVGTTLTLYVNGVKVAQVQDATYAIGDVGLLAGSYASPGVDIRFDNFRVYRP